MAMALRLPRTFDEFLDWEERQAERYEFVDGRIYAMSGGTGDHAQIAVNIIVALRPKLRGSDCRAVGSDLKLVVRATGRSFYPDVMVRCGQPVGQDESADDPVVLFEVLSRSTFEHDLITKRRSYSAIPSLRMVAYVSQEKAHVYYLLRDADGGWNDDEIEGLDATLVIEPLDASLFMAEIYEDTTVAAADMR